MNREIKFRAWDKLEERFIKCDEGYQGHYVLSLKGEFHNLQNGSGGKEYVVQQYTGLKDKNNKEVYEGDLVECDDVIRGRMYGEVVYDNDHGAFRIVFTYFLQWTFYKAENIEVIGNIFENPELLKYEQ